MATESDTWRPSRRALLTRAAGATPIAIVSPCLSAAPNLAFPTEPRARLAVTSYPFRTYLISSRNRERDPNLPAMDMLAFPAFIAETFGVLNINPLINHFSSTDPAYLDKFRASLLKARSHIVDLGLPGGFFYAQDASLRASSVAAAKGFIDVAVQAGSPSVRLHVQGKRGEKPDVGLASASLGEVAAHGETKNIVVNLENDNAVAEDPFFLVAVIERVNSRYLRALPDFGNSLIGRDQAFNHRAVSVMLGHAFNMCHVKDIIVEDNSGKTQQVDLGYMFNLAKSQGYRGYFSMEFETRAGDPVTGTKRLVEESLKYLS